MFSRDVPREVMNHHLDIGVISYLPEERELEAVEFHRDSLVLIVWPGHRLAKRREVDISDLGQETFVAHIVESPYRQRVVQMFARHKVQLRMDVELPTIESIKLFVEMKKGVAIVPRMCAEREVASGDLRELRIRQMRVTRKLYLVYRRDRPLPAAAQELVELIRQKPPRDARRQSRAQEILEGHRQSKRKAARWTDGVAGEEPAEIKHIEDVAEVLSINLQAHIQAVGFVNVRACRGVEKK